MPRKTALKIKTGQIIKRLRNAELLTQTDLAKELNVGKTTIANYESGYSEPDAEKLIILSNIFNVSIDYILGNTSIDNPQRFLEEKLAARHLSKSQLDKLFHWVSTYYCTPDTHYLMLPEMEREFKNNQNLNFAFLDIVSVIGDYWAHQLDMTFVDSFDLTISTDDKTKQSISNIKKIINNKIIELYNSLDIEKIVVDKQPDTVKFAFANVGTEGLQEEDIEDINRYIEMRKQLAKERKEKK